MQSMDDRSSAKKGSRKIPEKREKLKRQNELRCGPNSNVGGVTVLCDCANPFAIEALDPAFETSPITACIRKIRRDHVLGFAPIEIQLAVSFSAGELANFSCVESFHQTLKNDTISEALPMGT